MKLKTQSPKDIGKDMGNQEDMGNQAGTNSGTGCYIGGTRIIPQNYMHNIRQHHT